MAEKDASQISNELAELKSVVSRLEADLSAGRESDLSAMKSILTDIRWELQQQRRSTEIANGFFSREVFQELTKFVQHNQLDFVQTLEYLSRSECSFARFGDGEMRIMLRDSYNLRFQPYRPALARQLKSTFEMAGASSSGSLLVGFPHLFRDKHWSAVWLDVWSEVAELLSFDAMYGNSHVTRPVFFEQCGAEGVELWRQIWRGADVVVVTGKDSRFQMVDPLFDNVGSVRMIESRPVDAAVDLDRLFDDIPRQTSNADLILISLGPAGTVLAAELSRRNRRALDIGHISDSYLNVFADGVWPESMDVTRA